MRTLQTTRLWLEPLRAEHADAMFHGLSNERLYAYLSERPPQSVSTLRERYARLESRRSPAGDATWLNWIAITKSDGAVSGYIQATLTGSTASVAYVLFERAWGRGYAREAVEAMLAELRGAYAVRTATATVDPRNARSLRLLEQLGFALSETRTAAACVHGTLADESTYVRVLTS
jgi:[ribosomal protein S5]-alanine N-acetyltransferase